MAPTPYLTYFFSAHFIQKLILRFRQSQRWPSRSKLIVIIAVDVFEASSNLPKAHTHLPGSGSTFGSCHSSPSATKRHAMWTSTRTQSVLLGHSSHRGLRNRTQTSSILIPLLEQQGSRQLLQYSCALSSGSSTSGPLDLLDRTAEKLGNEGVLNSGQVFPEELRAGLRSPDCGRSRGFPGADHFCGCCDSSQVQTQSRAGRRGDWDLIMTIVYLNDGNEENTGKMACPKCRQSALCRTYWVGTKGGEVIQWNEQGEGAKKIVYRIPQAHLRT